MSDDKIARVRAALALRNARFAEEGKGAGYSDADLREYIDALIDAAPEMLRAVEERDNAVAAMVAAEKSASYDLVVEARNERDAAIAAKEAAEKDHAIAVGALRAVHAERDRLSAELAEAKVEIARLEHNALEDEKHLRELTVERDAEKARADAARSFQAEVHRLVARGDGCSNTDKGTQDCAVTGILDLKEALAEERRDNESHRENLAIADEQLARARETIRRLREALEPFTRDGDTFITSDLSNGE